MASIREPNMGKAGKGGGDDFFRMHQAGGHDLDFPGTRQISRSGKT
jgi:hypothetical protein